MNVTIGEKKTFDDWRLKLRSLVIGFPEAKTNTVDVPGADGLLDLSEALGAVRYGNRELEMIFDVMGVRTVISLRLETLRSRISMADRFFSPRMSVQE